MRKITRRKKLKVSPEQKKRKDLACSVARGIQRRTKFVERVDFLSSGSSTLNCALSGKAKDGGWARARVLNVVGDGSSGKTVCALELCFWCWKNIKKIKSKIFPKVKKITIVYNNAEGAMDFPIEKMYGEQFECDVEWICDKEIESTCRDYARRMRNLKKGEFLLYVIDSWDAIDSFAAHKRFDDSIKDDKEQKGSYDTEKQKFASKFFSKISGTMERNEKDATLLIVSQVRTKIGITFGKKQYRAGGKALDFYTHQVAWIREIEKMSKTKLGEKRVYGIKSMAKVERSKVAKPFREAAFTILYDYGLDDISSCVDYVWGNGLIKLGDKSYSQRASFIQYVERNGLQDEVVAEVEKKWRLVEREFEKEVEARVSRYK
jgi:recombination protein RecA